jgi:hypothetical protein
MCDGVNTTVCDYCRDFSPSACVAYCVSCYNGCALAGRTIRMSFTCGCEPRPCVDVCACGFTQADVDNLGVLIGCVTVFFVVVVVTMAWACWRLCHERRRRQHAPSAKPPALLSLGPRGTEPGRAVVVASSNRTSAAAAVTVTVTDDMHAPPDHDSPVAGDTDPLLGTAHPSSSASV